jgi:GTP 3',8-cyclase
LIQAIAKKNSYGLKTQGQDLRPTTMQNVDTKLLTISLHYGNSFMISTDTYGRHINYLRLSVTDRCNLRCQYCMPAEGVSKLQHNDILSFEQLLHIARQAVFLGIDKIRVTGGEPLVRKGIVGFLKELHKISELKELVLTTNGLLLREFAADLRRAGVNRLNVSLDSLDCGTYSKLTRGGDLKKALDGISAAEEVGFPPVKINTVVIRGVNNKEVSDFAALTLRMPYQIRFIEYMPTNTTSDWQTSFVSGEEILQQIRAVYPIDPLPDSEAAAPAKIFRIASALGTIGIITPISNHFCTTCNRIRVTATGEAKGCLFDGRGINLKSYLEGSDDELRAALIRVLKNKPERHHLLDANTLITPFAMSEIGG